MATSMPWALTVAVSKLGFNSGYIKALEFDISYIKASGLDSTCLDQDWDLTVATSRLGLDNGYIKTGT